MKRGEVWTTAGGSDYAGKPRPVVIVQSDTFSPTQSVTICPLTSDMTDAPLARPLIEPDGQNGLRLPSRLMIDKLTTVPRSKLGRRVGALQLKDIYGMDRGVAAFLGLDG